MLNTTLRPHILYRDVEGVDQGSCFIFQSYGEALTFLHSYDFDTFDGTFEYEYSLDPYDGYDIYQLLEQYDGRVFEIDNVPEVLEAQQELKYQRESGLKACPV